MKSLVFDIETDGLDAKKIWCISALRRRHRRTVLLMVPENYTEGLDMLLQSRQANRPQHYWF